MHDTFFPASVYPKKSWEAANLRYFWQQAFLPNKDWRGQKFSLSLSLSLSLSRLHSPFELWLETKTQKNFTFD
jgi:hypothetical protein